VADYSAGMTASIAGTTVSGLVTGFWIFNTAAVACSYRLVRYTAGTAGGGAVAETKKRLNAPTAICTVQAGHTADVTVTEDLGYRVFLAAAIGAGAFIPLDPPIETPIAGTTPGIGLVFVSGTAQICEVGYAWTE
jgi:hypothetical protein